MSPRVIIHIGANKTGSSAIQRFLSRNVLALRENGVVVPNDKLELTDNVGGFHIWTFQQMFADPHQGSSQLLSQVRKLFEASPGSSTVLLSAENLAANLPAPLIFQDLANEYDLKVILYIRRQDDFLLSSWQQWHSKITGDFWAWLLNNVGKLGNWQTHLENWEQVVPRSQISVRVFDRSRLTNGDVIADFFSLLGLSQPIEAFEYPPQAVNPSFSTAVMDLVMNNDLIFKDTHDNDFYRFVQNLTGSRYLKDRRESMLTFAQRQALVRTYDESNRWVKEHYMRDETRSLFPPVDESEFDYVSSDSLQQEQLEFLTTLVYQMYRQIESADPVRTRHPTSKSDHKEE